MQDTVYSWKRQSRRIRTTTRQKPLSLICPEPPAAPKTRVVATLDFTILQDLLAENASQIDIIIDRITGNSTDLEKRGPVRMALLRSLKSIREENITGRQLNWSLLEGLIRMDPMTAPVPSDPHGTHVAGILAGRN